jgi:hypothetical protein
MRYLVFFCAFFSLSAQPLPVAGVIVDHVSRTIRPVVAGEEQATAGAARVREFDAAWPAPDGRTVLVARSRALYLVRRLDGAMPVWREFRSEGPPVSRAAWSADGSTLALYLAEEKQIEFWKNCQGEPRRVFTAELSQLGERVVSFAVAPEARVAFLATQGRESGTLWILQQGFEPRMVLPLGKAGELQFIDGMLYAADRGRNEVLRYSGWDAAPRVETLVAAGHGLADPVGFALLADQKKLIVASAGTSELLVLNLRTGLPEAPVPLAEPPARFERLGPAPLFALDGGARQAPAWLYDASARRLLALAE